MTNLYLSPAFDTTLHLTFLYPLLSEGDNLSNSSQFFINSALYSSYNYDVSINDIITAFFITKQIIQSQTCSFPVFISHNYSDI